MPQLMLNICLKRILANSDYIIIYGVDTDDSGIKDLKRMRLGLTLSLLSGNTYFTYDIGPGIMGRHGGLTNMT